MDIPSESMNLFSFPLDIVIVDDDADYLDLIKQQLKNYTSLVAYSSPTEAIKNINPIDINIKDLLETKFIGIQDLNYKGIENFVQNSKNVQGILIVDYDMPEMNGIELFSKYNNPNIIKILLTNAYSMENAVNALHDKRISHYLPKQKIGTLLKVVNHLQHRLFNDLTQNLIRFLGTNSLKFLLDKPYIKIFNEVCQQYDINKYYILNSYGNYYLEGKTDKFIFSIYNLTDLIEIAKEIPNPNKREVEQGNLIPSYFLNEDSLEYKLIHANKFGGYSYCIEKLL